LQQRTEPLNNKKRHKQEIELAYYFFLECEEQRILISLQDIQEATTYALSTAAIYCSKKWWWFLTETLDGHYLVRGLKGYTLEEFTDLHRQKRGPSSKGLSSHFLVSLSPALLTWLTEKAHAQGYFPQTLVTDLIKGYCEQEGFSDPYDIPIHIQVQLTRQGQKRQRSSPAAIIQLPLLINENTSSR
jgi:hypothetical protein